MIQHGYYQTVCNFTYSGHGCPEGSFPTVAPVIMTPRMINSAATVPSRTRNSLAGSSASSAKLGFATLAPLRLGLGSKRITSGDLQILEVTEDLLLAEVPEPEEVALNVSLLRGFNATIPSSEQGKIRRRQMRNVDTPRLGLRKLGLNARGLLSNSEEDDNEGQSVVSEDDVVVVRRPPASPKKKGRESLSASKRLGKEELTRQRREILIDKENIHVRKVRCSLFPVFKIFESNFAESDQRRHRRNQQQDPCSG